MEDPVHVGSKGTMGLVAPYRMVDNFRQSGPKTQWLASSKMTMVQELLLIVSAKCFRLKDITTLYTAAQLSLLRLLILTHLPSQVCSSAGPRLLLSSSVEAWTTRLPSTTS